MSYQEYQEVPAYEQAVYKDGMPVKSEALIWAGPVAPPPVGEKIKVSMNGLGNGDVVGYFSQEGYLGLRVQLDNPPGWYVKQNKGNPVGHIFGPEFKPLEEK
jgi:hypothetical protein